MRPFPLAIAGLLVAVLVARFRRLGWVPRVILGVLATGFALYGVGVIPKPDVEEILLDLGEALGAWTYLLVGALAFLETGAFVGLVAPGETAVVAGGVFAGQGRVDVVALLILVWLCCVAGDTVSYWLGRRLGRGFMVKHGPRVKITEERLRYVEGFFARRGGVTILVGRFIGLVRALAPFVAGASKMRFGQFLPYDVVGCGLWASAFVLLGYFSWENIDHAARIASTGGLAIGTTAAIGLCAFLASRYLRTREQRRQVRSWALRRLRRVSAR
jgi:undecaprenyl-diphosphatase